MARIIPTAETRERWWKRISLWIVFAAVSLGAVGLAWGVQNAHETKLLAQENLTSQINHHVATEKQQSLIIAQNKEIITLIQTVHDTQETNKGTVDATEALEQEVANVIEGLPAADKELTSEALNLDADLVALCVTVHADCSPIPPP